MTPLGGYGMTPICLFAGLSLLFVTHVLARRWVGGLRERIRSRRVRRAG